MCDPGDHLVELCEVHLIIFGALLVILLVDHCALAHAVTIGCILEIHLKWTLFHENLAAIFQREELKVTLGELIE
jgi:hypothetical protein